MSPITEAQKPIKSENFTGTIRRLHPHDLHDITAILNSWIPYIEPEISAAKTQAVDYGIIEEMIPHPSTPDTSKQFYVAVEGDWIVGVMGIGSPNEYILQFAQTNQPAELIHAYVSSEKTRRGIGTALLQRVEQAAQDHDFTEIILSIPPPHLETGQAFFKQAGYKQIQTILAQSFYRTPPDKSHHPPILSKVL